MSVTQFTNHLLHESSPYLLQHAHNPVDWYPWGNDAFQKAKAEDKPILLSCGYSACHWCHVMAEESFEDPEIAALMNQYFINIKVDREERPDIDQLYQQAVQAIAGQGGWPLTVFLDHARRPFFGGTYFPPESRSGRIGFSQLLEAIHKRWRGKRDLIATAGQEMQDYLQSHIPRAIDGSRLPKRDFPGQALEELYLYADRRRGGFGKAPKFPNPVLLQLFFKLGTAAKHQASVDHGLFTLKRMARGGIYDQLGGGFHRYATDEFWLIPHFEKMLYDNAQLLKVYAMGYQLQPDPELRRVAAQTAAYIRREMTSPEGGFYAAQDADSEGKEGVYYLWSMSQLKEALTEETARVVLKYYGVTEAGNFEGLNVLNRLTAGEMVLSPSEQKLLEEGNQQLYRIRAQRVKPFRDEKIITGWNGLMIGAFAYAYQVFHDPSDYESAKAAARFVFRELKDDQGDLARFHKDGKGAGTGCLEDYSLFAQGLLDLYEADFDEAWLRQALAVTGRAMEKFSNGDGLYYLNADTEQLIARPLSGEDQVIPSGVAVQAENLLRLHAFTGRRDLHGEVEKILTQYHLVMKEVIWSYGAMIGALDNYYQGFKEFTFISEQPEVPEILVKVRQRFIPYRILVWRKDLSASLAAHPARQLLQDRTMVDGKPTCYLCDHFNCQSPVTDWEALNDLIVT